MSSLQHWKAAEKPRKSSVGLCFEIRQLFCKPFNSFAHFHFHSSDHRPGLQRCTFVQAIAYYCRFLQLELPKRSGFISFLNWLCYLLMTSRTQNTNCLSKTNKQELKSACKVLTVELHLFHLQRLRSPKTRKSAQLITYNTELAKLSSQESWLGL